MTFKSQVTQDVIKVFLDGAAFAEDLTYTPKAGVPKIIKAVIIRKRLDPAYEDTGRVLLNQGEIFIANDAAAGVTSINKGGDIVSFAETIGGAVISWIVADILDHDEGIWHLLVQK
ncbi:MAG: hypothetical protein PHC29_02135 [Candidatus Omnitrophica bacterium]|nr:hypothetical protein [Candidatus Omnitrophota bacterium]